MKTASTIALLILAGISALGQTRPAKPAAASPKPAAKTTSSKSSTTPTAPLPPSDNPLSALGEPTGIFRKGNRVVNLGLGIGSGYGYSFESMAESSPAISLSAEKGVLEVGPGVIGIGALIGYKGYHYDYPNSEYKARWTNVVALARGSFHYDLLQNEQLDTYAGVSLGLRIEKHKNTYQGTAPANINDDSYGGLRFERGIYLGARYFLTKNIGAFAEAGYDMTYLKLGLSGSF